MRGAVVKREIPPTRTRPRRCVAKSVHVKACAIEWDPSISPERNRGAALLRWQRDNGETLPRDGGWLPDGDIAWVARW